MILRPALVAMRERNPWRRLRTRFEGWNVRFIAAFSVICPNPVRIRAKILFVKPGL